MDFFEAQERARRKTKWLVFYFALAVLGTTLAGYAAALLLLGQVGDRPGRHHGYYSYDSPNYAAPVARWWDPQLFGLVAGGTALVVGLASAFKWALFRQGGAAVAEMVGGRQVSPHTIETRERRLLNVVEEMSIASGVPLPAVYVLDQEEGINAFAAGLTTSDAVVTVTRGTLEKLNRDELQGVIGHEFSHILNGDMRLNVRLTAIVFGILVIGLIGRGILRGLGRGRVRVRGKGGGGIALLLAVGLALLIIGYIGYFFGRLIQAAVSRQREFLADAASVQFTRNPAGLTGALKKIGGYALGSRLETAGAEQLGHFFFAQGFQSYFGGLWATHPPLDERIRVIDVQWDGKFTTAKDAVGRVVPDEPPVRSSVSRPVSPASGLRSPVSPLAAIAAIGALTSEHVAAAQSLLATLPASLRTAAQAPSTAPALVCVLLLDTANNEVRSRQRTLIAGQAGSEILRTVDDLAPALQRLRPEHKLPLLQLALPALRQLPPTALAGFQELFDRLVNSDGHVSTFEFALKSLLRRTLAQGRAPASAGAQVWSFEALAGEIAVVLSVLAHASSNVPDAAAKAFAPGAVQLRMLQGRLAFLGAGQCSLDRFDAALDRLATASGPIKQRVLTAGAHVVSDDGVIRPEEFELLRVVAAALDCPMPPLSVAA